MASITLCLIVASSFAVFAVNQTSSASVHQQEELNSGGAAAATRGAAGSRTSAPPHEGTVHKTLDEVARKITSPFAGITSGSSSEWVVRGGNLLFALIVYGFALGYLARFIRVRA